MGCCLSSRNGDPQHHQNASNLHYPPPSKTPPAPAQPMEEERIKEVLSETSVPRQQILVPILQHKCTQTPLIEECEIEVNTDLINKQEEEEEEDSRVQASQFSEICSSIYSETLSMATTTTTTVSVTENTEDEAVSKRVDRSPIKVPRKRPHTCDLGGARERASKSPARRGNYSSRSGRGRELSSQARNTQRSVRSRSSEVKRDSGEGRGRRSRSPATRKASGVGRGDSPVTRTGRAGGMRLLGAAGLENDTILPKQGNESLDNPQVSMECFIFL